MPSDVGWLKWAVQGGFTGVGFRCASGHLKGGQQREACGDDGRLGVDGLPGSLPVPENRWPKAAGLSPGLRFQRHGERSARRHRYLRPCRPPGSPAQETRMRYARSRYAPSVLMSLLRLVYSLWMMVLCCCVVLPSCLTSVSYSALVRRDGTSNTWRPRYVPQFGQAWCARRVWRHCGQMVNWGICTL